MLYRFASSLSMVIAGTACAFLTHLVLAKTLDAAEYGIFSFVFSLSLLIGVFSLFGFQNSSVKIISVFQTEEKDKNKTRTFSRFAFIFTTLLAVISAIAVYTGLFLMGLAEKYPIETLALGVLITPLMVTMRLHAAFLRGFSKATLSVLYETTLREGLFLTLILLSLFFANALRTGFDVLCLFFVALFIASAASWIHARFYLNKQSSTTSASKKLKKEWITTSFPMMLVIFAQRLLRRSDIIILGLMVHPALVGAYAIAAQFSEASSIGQKGIFSIFSPQAAQLYKNKKNEELKKLYQKMQLLGVATTGAFCLVIAILAPYLLEFFGDDYTIAYTALLILLIGQFLNICFGPVGILMLMTGHEKTAMRLTIASALGNIICNPVAIYFYGITGAAITTLFFLVLRGFLSYLEMKKQKLL